MSKNNYLYTSKTVATNLVVAADQRFVLMNSHITKVRLNVFKKMLVIVERNFERELELILSEKNDLLLQKSSYYLELDRLKVEIQQAFSDKQDEYNELESAKAAINRWHSKSKSNFFGNGGKPLPKHSLFGQSFGDLDSLKSKRSRAIDNIASTKRRISHLKESQQSYYQSIDDLKNQIQECTQLERVMVSNIRTQQKLIEDGYTKISIEREIEMLTAELKSYDHELQVLIDKEREIQQKLNK